MNGAGSLQFPLYTSYSKTLKQTSIRHYHHPPAMKDRPPPSAYGAVYVPPHHRHRSLITSSAPSNHSSSAPFVVDSKTVTTHNNNNNNNNSFPRGNSYPYLPYHQHQHQQQHRHQLKKISHFDADADDFSEEGSDFDIDPPSNPPTISLFSLSCLELSRGNS
ncbi:hypothetical protein TEA_004328 [Camellia sinensis var. sinensis]|uniref:Uncharacterized protein n=1 Tax=Camellia sinensis var. sinensis TaxID=542762 RepID=A0A4S4DK73_CAMSN|nr:hypothetical protein TEA_004328 [Camellia sinensis var. sinensis]